MNVQQAIEEMATVQARYARFGACDTESRGVVVDLLEALRSGVDPEVPATAEGWQLYTRMDGSEAAAGQLHTVGVALTDAAKGDALGLARYLAGSSF